jgi:hypothetical protein
MTNTSAEYADAEEVYGGYHLYFLPVTVYIGKSLPSGLLESDTRFCRDIFVRYHIHLEYSFRLKSGIDGKSLLPFASSGKCTREENHGDGRLLRTLLQGHCA